VGSAMTKDILQQRIVTVTERIENAASRSGRRREDVTLVAVTKTVTPEVVTVARELGLTHFGESRPQELWKKHTAHPTANWHFIGHLQRNKLDKTIPMVKLVHSVDSERLLLALHEFGVKTSPVPILLEVNCSREENKGGIPPLDVFRIADQAAGLPGVTLEGLMTMAENHKDVELCRPTFAELRELRDQLRPRTGLPLPHLSMGMSNDFEIAIEEGATHVRIGSSLFAE
jgi:PLP dependent protein